MKIENLSKLSSLLFTTMLLAVNTLQGQYFQQEVNTTISVSLNDEKHTLSGNIEWEYSNNAQKSLDTIYFLLYPNAYSSQKTAFAQQQLDNNSTAFYDSKLEDKGFIQGLKFQSNGQILEHGNHNGQRDLAWVKLPQALMPNETIILSTPFTTQFPKVFSRLGRDKDFYAATQWFPKPAVFDNAGWHLYPYLDQGEFYYEYGTYDVSISLPKNYVVGATGDLQTQSEVEWMEKKAQEDGKWLAKEPYVWPSDTSIPSSEEFKTIRFTAENVHDFAWFAGKQLCLQMGKCELVSGKSVSLFSIYPYRYAKGWDQSLDDLADGLINYSQWVGDYPYNQCTVVGGPLSAGSGMEYPMVTIVGGYFTGRLLKTIIVHEVGHNWFQGILGTNERVFPWMDEGINSYYEQRVMNLDQSDKTSADVNEERATNSVFCHLHKERLTQATGCHSADFTNLNYGLCVYGEGSRQMKHLEQFIGQDAFDAAMKVFFEKWKFKHPQPSDLQASLEAETGKKLNWFFKDLVQDNADVDFSAQKIQESQFVIGNKWKSHFPFLIQGLDAEGKQLFERWVEPQGNDPIIADFPETENLHTLVIDPEALLSERNIQNNRIRFKGLFPKFEPLSLALVNFDKGSKSETYAIPLLAFNEVDGFIIGLGFSNHTLPTKNIELNIAPMYGFKSKDPIGMAQLHINHFPREGMVRKWRFGISALHFNDDDFLKERQDDPVQGFHKLSPFIETAFRKKSFRSKVSNSLKVQAHWINNAFFPIYSFADSSFRANSRTYLVNQLLFSHKNQRTLNPFDLTLDLQQGKNMLKTSGTANFKFRVPGIERGIKLRMFAGAFIQNELTFTEDDNVFANQAAFQLGLTSGDIDYLYNERFFSRRFSGDQVGWLNQQAHVRDGGLKVRANPYAFGKSDSWLASVNLEAGLPIPIPISVYADLATFDGAGSTTIGSERLLFDGGLALILVPDILEFYFPLFASQDIQSIFNSYGGYWERVSFTFRINDFNPARLRDRLLELL